MPTIFAVSRILILLLFYTFNSAAQNNNPNSSCPSSSCGNITNISFPFRLKGDPISCGYPHPIFELDCQQNRAILNVRSKKYYVQEINYPDFSIKLVDPGVNIGNLSSCPMYPNSFDDWPSTLFDQFLTWNIPVVFIYCLAPVNSLQYVKAPYCGNRSSIFFNSSEIYGYAMVGDRIGVTDLEESCTAYSVERVSISNLRDLWDFSSWERIHDGFGYGFELSWFRVLCGEFERTYGHCSLEGNTITCRHYCREDIPLMQLGFSYMSVPVLGNHYWCICDGNHRWNSCPQICVWIHILGWTSGLQMEAAPFSPG